jgi:hypothetical protein
MQMIKIIWFKNAHEQRLNWLKFGLMQLHEQKKILFHEKNNDLLKFEAVSDAIKNHEHRHTVILKYINNNISKFILVDAEDSFFQICSLIKDVDLYFCSSYNSDFFINKKDSFQLNWQSSEDVLYYNETAKNLINKFGNYFNKVKKLIPIAPSLDIVDNDSNLVVQKYKNVYFKLYQFIFKKNPWKNAYKLFNKRYNILLSYRNIPTEYDIVLLDSLWGWPSHRIELHKQLQLLKGSLNILSELRYVKNDQTTELDPSLFPMITNPVGKDYELKLAASKLGVFATGFHFGWRNIVMLAFMIGIPVYTDEIILEPHFDFNLFKHFTNHKNFEDIELIIQSLNKKEFAETKKHNQQVFDSYMHPTKVAEYFISECLSLV